MESRLDQKLLKEKNLNRMTIEARWVARPGEGADVIGDVIVCPLHGSSFKVTTGELIDWCVSPPIIGPLTGLLTFVKIFLGLISLGLQRG